MGREILKGDCLWGKLKFGSNALWITYVHHAFAGQIQAPRHAENPLWQRPATISGDVDKARGRMPTGAWNLDQMSPFMGRKVTVYGETNV